MQWMTLLKIYQQVLLILIFKNLLVRILSSILTLIALLNVPLNVQLYDENPILNYICSTFM